MMVFMNQQQATGNRLLKPNLFRLGDGNPDSAEDLEDLDEDQIVKIFQAEGILKKSKKQIEQDKVLFDQIECAQSLYVFSKENRFRIFCYELWKLPMWENTVLVLILLSSAKLATDTYNYNFVEGSDIMIALENIDSFFDYAFIIELSVKVVA